MNKKYLKDYVGKIVTFRTVSGDFFTATLTGLTGNHAEFEKEGGDKIYIKIFNIAQVQLENK